jgi:hypothetical protein
MGEELDGTYDCGWTFASNVYDTLALSLLRLLGDVCNTLYRMHKYMLVRYVYIFVLLIDMMRKLKDIIIREQRPFD